MAAIVLHHCCVHHQPQHSPVRHTVLNRADPQHLRILLPGHADHASEGHVQENQMDPDAALPRLHRRNVSHGFPPTRQPKRPGDSNAGGADHLLLPIHAQLHTLRPEDTKEVLLVHTLLIANQSSHRSTWLSILKHSYSRQPYRPWMAEALSRFSAMIALVIYYYRLQIEERRRLWLQRRSQRYRCTVCQALRISQPKLVTMKVTISSLARSQCQSFPRVYSIIPSNQSRVSSHPVQNWLPSTAIVSILIVLYFFSMDSMRSFLMARISSLCSPTSSAIYRSKLTALMSAVSLVLSISFLARRASSCNSYTSAITLSYSFHSSSNLLLNFSSNSRKRCQSGRSGAICLLCCVFP